MTARKIAQAESVRAPFGITVEAALGLPCLAGAHLVAGEQGKAGRIRVVNIMEVPDIVRWMRGGELLLTTAYPVRDDAPALTRLIPALAERGLAGLGIKTGPYLKALPPEMLVAADRLGFPIVEIPSEVMFNDVLSEVLGTILNRQALELERFHVIHERLTAVALAGGSNQALLSALAELIHLPAAILDEHGHLVAVAGQPPFEEPPGVTRPIKAGGSVHGVVAVWTDGDTAPPHQLMAMEQAATIAAMAIAQERAVVSRDQRHRTLLLMELVSSRPLDRAEIGRRAAAMDWDLDSPRAAVLVELTTSAELLRVAGQPVEDELVRIAQRAAGPASIVWALRSGLAMLVEPRPSLAAVCQAVHDHLARARSGLRVMVASGCVYDDFSDFQRSYQEAIEALALGRNVYGDDTVLRHEELGIYRMLYQLPVHELERHVQEALGPLLDYDRQRKGHLLQTLECFLRHDRNRVAAAEELNVHYNTLRYRLEQIERLTNGIDRHVTSRLQLEMAVHAHRLLVARAGA